VLLPYLRLLRIGLIASPAADVVAGLCLAGADWSVAAVRTALASVCVYAAGMVLNDHADRREDAVHRPDRPIPAGQIAPGTALVLGLGLLALGIALSAVPLLHAALAAGVLAYDYVLKQRAPVWAAGLLMGSLRGLNLGAGIALATTPVEDPRLAAIAIGVYAIYVLCVTILGSYEDLRLIPQRAARSIQTIPPIAAALVILICPSPWPAAAVAIALALAFQIRVARVDKAWDQASIRTSMGYLLLGTQLYTALLAMAHDRPVEAFGIVAAAAAARYAMRRYPLT
jgi:hypothetical protein